MSVNSSEEGSNAETVARGNPNEKRVVYVHVNFIKVGEVNTLKETFDAHILIKSRWREPSLDGQEENLAALGTKWNPQIFIENVVGDPQPKVTLTTERNDRQETFVVERKRFRGSFVELMELWDFPFDVQELSILIKSEKSLHETELIEDPDEMHAIHKRSFVGEQEFRLYEFVESSIPPLSVDQQLGIVKQKKPSIKVTVHVARRFWYFFWNIFLLMSTIVSLSFISFGISALLLANRQQVGVVFVLTAVTFKTLINSNIPKISYFTYLDGYMVTMLVLLAAISIWHGLMTQVAESRRINVDRIGLICFAVIYILFHIGFIAFVCIKPFGKRRRTGQKEKEYQKRHSERMKTQKEA